MKPAGLLACLKQQAEDMGQPLDKIYMQTLRQAFMQRKGMDEKAYGRWRESALPGIAFGESENNMTMNEALHGGDIPALLSLGDACAADRGGTGSYYTPASIARFMASNALRQVLVQRFSEHEALIVRYFQEGHLLPSEAEILQKLMCRLRILDLACGNGVFLSACLDWYLGLSRHSGWDPDGAVFTAECLYGTDIRRDALESWAISLGLRSPDGTVLFPALKTACLSSVDGDGVLEVPWIEAVLNAGGFDLIIGNPPYLGEKGNRQLFEGLRSSSFGQRHYEGRMDLFYYFLHRGIDLLRAGGLLCQLTTSYYATADFAAKLRARLRENGGITALVSFNEQRVFAGALGHHLILFYQKGVHEGPTQLINYTEARRLSAYDFEDLSFDAESSCYRLHSVQDRRKLFDERGHMILDPARWETDCLEALNRACPERLKALVRISQGIVSGADRADSGGIFVLEPHEIFDEALPWLVPWYKNGDIRRYRASGGTDKRLLYIRNEEEAAITPGLLAHFAAHREKLSLRRECQTGARPWYGLQWPRDREIFEGPKLVAPQRCYENRFAYTEEPWFASADVYFLTKPIEGVSLWALLAYLNSDVLGHWFQHCGKRKGRQLELYATPLGNVPVNRQWLAPGGVLHGLGQELYHAAGTEEARVPALRLQVDTWLKEALKPAGREKDSAALAERSSL